MHAHGQLREALLEGFALVKISSISRDGTLMAHHDFAKSAVTIRATAL